MEELLMIKILFIFAMLISAGATGAVPLYSKSFKQNKCLVSVGNCFAAGIFLLVGLVHLLADSQEAFKEALDEDPPYAYIICIIGYTLILFIEKIMFHHSHSSNSKETIDYHHHSN